MKGDFTRRTFDQALQQVAGQTHYTAVLQQQGRVPLDADWNEQQALSHHRIETETLDVIGRCGAPRFDAGFSLTPTKDGRSLIIGNGRFYVDGILCENPEDVDILHQPFLPLPTGADIASLLGGSRAAIAYLDVWRRHITALDDPLLREVALGGPDTTTRVQTVWQVKLLPLRRQEQGELTCGGDYPEWRALIGAGNPGALIARTQPAPDAEPCELPPTAGYLRLENQLYRVEIHQANPPTFKWSRDNGSVVTNIESGSGTTLIVHDVGPDDILGFASSQWVEIVNDVTELSGQPGQLVQIDSVYPAQRKITLRSSLNAAFNPIDPSLRPHLRRWDHSAGASSTGIAASGGWQDTEGGIQVQFTTGKGATYHTGDYWLIPARTATGEIEWPPYQVPNTSPQSLPPLGIQHHYCRLGVVEFLRESPRVVDCRPIFSPLATPAMHVERISWGNDRLLPFQTLAESGLVLMFDYPPDSVCLNSSTCIVTFEIPADRASATPAFDISFIGEGAISAVSGAPTMIRWQPANALLNDVRAIVEQIARQSSSRQIRVRVTIKGHTFWSTRNTARLYLDGQAFGQHSTAASASGAPQTDLQLPSGNGNRASDFESWFFLGVEQSPTSATLLSVAVDPAALTLKAAQGSVPTPGQALGTVILSAPAPTGDLRVSLASGDTAVTVPASVTIPAGQSSATFGVVASNVTAGNSAAITATMGGVSRTATLVVTVLQTIVAQAEIILTELTISDRQGSNFSAQRPAYAGTPLIGEVILSANAPAGGAVVSLFSSNASVARVPSTITITSGNNSGMFEFTSAETPGTAAITASYGNSQRSVVFSTIRD